MIASAPIPEYIDQELSAYTDKKARQSAKGIGQTSRHMDTQRCEPARQIVAASASHPPAGL
jgi:hypothetical protein